MWKVALCDRSLSLGEKAILGWSPKIGFFRDLFAGQIRNSESKYRVNLRVVDNGCPDAF